MARVKAQLGGAIKNHVAAAKYDLDQAWRLLENMPPTCRGGIEIAGTALDHAARAAANLHSIGGKSARERRTKLFGEAHRAVHAAHQTLRFFAGVCEAPHGAARERPSFHRVKR